MSLAYHVDIHGDGRIEVHMWSDVVVGRCPITHPEIVDILHRFGELLEKIVNMSTEEAEKLGLY